MNEINEIHAPAEQTLQTRLIDPENKAELSEAAQLLRRGGLVAFPTETVYGLGANAYDPDAARRVYAAKGRPSDNPLIVHIAALETAEQIAHTTPLFYRLAERYWPGPLTIILPKKDSIPTSVTGGLNSVGIRFPSDPVAAELILQSGVPIAAPSANLSGKPSPTTAAHVIRDLYGRADAIVCGRDCDYGVESTVVRAQGDKLTVLRPGAVTPEQLRALLGEENVLIDPTVLQKAAEGMRPQAPGMKYRHYAPCAPVILLRGEPREIRAALLRCKADGKKGILCYEEDAALLKGRLTMSLGPREDERMQAHRLFACLRAFDETDAACIYAPLPAKDGIGLAVYNRLEKAAGFTVRDAKEILSTETK